ncbi:uncharacterized protein BDR25DRAFT_318884 [Lindgomyces ingoldianus]|uniref:Uncharacterized protein n=1 Tax=Lindgomyces ingoldianus TaxID=673940 RepID=A0ACB6QDB4_9PLEO|nr:uncharacterized protein BDR25DRAFT_318884 [Lindgomyces ingoldianus]KAF2464904.1 hypothetical protein BDR25DRAFT_318884 [Lindgomyces ingoldianus]
MLSKYLQHVAYAAALCKLASAKSSKIVPQDLSVGFASSGIDIQVSYTGDAVNGFNDGTTFGSKDVANTPTFALGDSSNIVANKLYTILLVDTTCDDARTLHFAQTNFKYNFDITNLETSAKALQDYKAPGAFKETGDDRKYSFIMYDNPENNELSTLKLPTEGGTFDVKQFQDDNGFEDPVAGVGMVVKLGGASNCGGTPSNGGGSSSSNAPSAASSAGPASSAPAKTSSAANQASSAAASKTTAKPSSPESTQEASNPTSSGGAAQTTNVVAASSVVPNVPGAPASTVLATSVVAGATGSATGTDRPALQTGSDASTVSIVTARCVFVAALIASAAVLMG